MSVRGRLEDPNTCSFCPAIYAVPAKGFSGANKSCGRLQVCRWRIPQRPRVPIDSDGAPPGGLLATWPDSGEESHVGSVGVQPPSDGSGTCSLHRLTRALRCDCAVGPPEGEGEFRVSRGQLPGRFRGPPRCLASESLDMSSGRPSPASLARRASMACTSSGHGLGSSRTYQPASNHDRLLGTGSASMPTLWSVNHRKPFGCASPYRAVYRRRDSPAASSEQGQVMTRTGHTARRDSDSSFRGSSRLVLPTHGVTTPGSLPTPPWPAYLSQSV